MFTVAHSVTLALSMFKVITLSAAVVEPLIALSIAYVGLENLWLRQRVKHRLIIVILFGLLHGLGFASVLSEFGMPKEDFGLALLSFNLGIEIGQLAVILVAWLVLAYWWKIRDKISTMGRQTGIVNDRYNWVILVLDRLAFNI